MLKLLIIDDEPAVGHALKRLFFDFADVDTVNAGRKAWELLNSQDYDAILCDLHMPGLTGVDLYDRLAEKNPGEEEKLIFMTGGLSNSKMQAFFRSIDNHLILKPFEYQELVVAIEDVSGSPT